MTFYQEVVRLRGTLHYKTLRDWGFVFQYQSFRLKEIEFPDLVRPEIQTVSYSDLS